MHPFQIWDADHPYHIAYLNLFPYSIDHLYPLKRFWPLFGIRSWAPPTFYAVVASKAESFHLQHDEGYIVILWPPVRPAIACSDEVFNDLARVAGSGFGQ